MKYFISLIAVAILFSSNLFAQYNSLKLPDIRKALKSGATFNDEKDRPIASTFRTISPAEAEKMISKGLRKAKGTSFIRRYTFAANEGVSGGSMDFLADTYSFVERDDSTLILWERKLYNPYDFSNLLWGAAMARLGFAYAEVKIGSECNAFVHTYKQNPSLNKPWHGLCFSGDSVEDQRAIKKGFFGILGKKANANCKTNSSFDGIRELTESIKAILWGQKEISEHHVKKNY